MSAERPGSLQSVPTLTEEVTLPGAPEAVVETVPVAPPRTVDEPPAVATAPVVAAPVIAAAVVAAPPMPTEAQLTERILVEVQRQVETVLEYRLRELLTPILTRATDALVREARSELSSALRDVVARSVAQELLRQRSR